MPKIRILSPTERKAFQSPPLIQLSEKVNYFEISDAIKKALNVVHSPYRKVGFVLLLSYFRRVGRERYQYYEFCRINTPLSQDARKEMSSLSSRAQIGTHGASYVYNYGDF